MTITNGCIKIEFYRPGIITTLYANAVPREGEYVNIDRKQYRVAYVAWAIDTNPDQFRANVELERVADDEVGPSRRALQDGGKADG